MICFVGAVEGGFVNIIDMMMCARIIRTSDQYSMISMFFSWNIEIAWSEEGRLEINFSGYSTYLNVTTGAIYT